MKKRKYVWWFNPNAAAELRLMLKRIDVHETRQSNGSWWDGILAYWKTAR